ncbi:MAG TPA: arsenic resistance N-acetyltransferase ArsN2 [Roseiflexaceae bacterium]|nr:arsenic resistance N-acetyltransferase ArsN2 [Roseiflexaceae bacterium]
MTIVIEPAAPGDTAAIARLLGQSGLPLAGLDEQLATALVARRAGELAGCVALELYGDQALLRSLAVAPELRGQGLGQRLTEAALAEARGRGVRNAFLLTETAPDFFQRFGFRPVARADLPQALHASAELRGACPESALAMKAEIG